MFSMQDDEEAKKDLAQRYAEAKKRGEELATDPKLVIPDKLMDDVVGCMFGSTDKGTRVHFINGPWDGTVEYMKTTPDVLPVRLDPPQVQIVGRRVAVSIFYDVAVYELSSANCQLVYKFAGYSECMEGLG